MRGRALAGVGAGVLSRFVPPGLVDEVLAEARREAGEGLPAGRQRALPGRLVVYFVLGLCLFSDLPYGEVVRELAVGLRGVLAAAGWQVPAATALTRARRRVGERPLELLFGRLCSALTPVAAPWSHICGRLAVAWDGTTIKAPASDQNRAAFTRAGRKSVAARPKLRLVALVACGTRALAGAAVGPYRTGERALAAGLLGRLQPGMLLLADRGFYSWSLWNAAAATRADLLWRVPCSMHLPVARELGDGSWLSVIPSPAQVAARCDRNGKRRRRRSKLPPDTGPLPGITVRVIAFLITITTDDGTITTEPYRLITTLTSPAAAPAAALAAGYARRWAAETGFRELKTYLHGPGRILRSRTPALARQELWACLVIYQAIRAVICAAAASAGIDPGKISFTTTLRAVRRTLPAARTRPARALAEAEADILASLLPDRDARICLRAVREPRPAYPAQPRDQPLARHATCTVTITSPARPPATPASQPRQAPGHPSQAP